MTLIPLPITKANYHIDPVSKSIVSDAIYDGYIDESATLRRRGGLVEWADVGDGPGNGLFAWKPSNGAAEQLVVRTGLLLKLVKEDGTVLTPGGLTVFANTCSSFADGSKVNGDPWLYVFDGDYPVYVLANGSTMLRLTAPSGAPANCSFGAWLDGRFLVQDDGTRNFYATDTNPGSGDIEPDYFLAADNPLTAETKPDTIGYLGATTQEAIVWGKQGMEVWVSDSNFFSTLKGAFSNAGLLAPYSVVQADETIFALCLVDGLTKRAVVKMSGRTPVIVSNPIEAILDAMDTVDDARAWITADSEYVIAFPTEGQTWCYDYRHDAWYRWTTWDEVNGERDDFIAWNAATIWGKTFFQSRTDGKIYEYRRDVFTDDGAVMATEWRTGNIGRGYSSRCNKLRLQLKRGVGDGAGGEGQLEVKWRDNGKQEWSNPRLVSLGEVGQYDVFKELYCLGTYKTRQYSFRLTDATDLAIVNVWEDIEVLPR
jgi:hypothetical protein